VSRFRKLPVEIEAWLVNSREPLPEWLQAALAHGTVKPHHYIQDALNVETLEGIMLARPGDWLIQGVAGEIYPCKPDIFAATYEAAA
jgi:hypothetical protein